MTYEKKPRNEEASADIMLPESDVGFKVACQLSEVEKSEFAAANAKIQAHFEDEVAYSDAILAYVNGSPEFSPSERRLVAKVNRLLEEATYAN